MTSIAELGIRVESGDAVEAVDNLGRLVQAGGQAEKAAESLSSSFDKASAAAGGLASAEDRVAESTEEAMARLTAMAKASLESSQYYQNLSSSVNSTSSAMDGGSVAARDWNAELAAINSRAQALLATEDRLAEEARKAAAAVGVQAEGLQALLGKINPAIAALDRLDEQQAQLQKYKSAGLIDADTFKEYSGRIDASRQKLGDFDESLRKTGASSAQTEQALRQLPSQFSDIFTSLIGGQNPLRVFLEQGLQIKDSFGGIGPTIDVLGGKIKSILGIGGGIGTLGDSLQAVGSGGKAAAEGAEAAGEGIGNLAEGANTAADAGKNAKEAADALRTAGVGLSVGMGAIVAGAVVAAAALVALGFAYNQGSSEATAYTTSLIMTGNTAGTTAEQLGDMARAVSDANGTVNEAAQTLALLAGSTRISASSFTLIATAAANMEDATGKSTAETVKNFERLAKEPLKASLEFTEQLNYLTAATYSQIAALESQGDTQAAAEVAFKAYAEATNTRAAQIAENLGVLEGAWKEVSDAAKNAWDAMRDVGRDQSLEQQINNTRKILEDRKTGWLSGMFEGSESTRVLQDRLKLLEKARDAQAESAKEEGRLGEARRKGNEAYAKYQQDELAGRSKADKMNDALEAKQRQITTSRAAGFKITAEQEEAAYKAIRDNSAYKESPKAASAVDLTAFNDAQNQLKSITGYYDNIQKELDAAQKAGLVSAESYSSQRMAIVEQEKGDVTAAYGAEIAALEAARAKGTTSAEQRIQLDQKIADARAGMVKAQQDADTQLNVLASNEQGRLKKQELAVKTYTDALQQQVETLREQGIRSAATLGMGDRQQGLYNQQNSINDRINQQRLDLANQYGDGSRGMSLDEYSQKLAALDKVQRDLQETAVANYNDMTAAQGDWSAGASSAFQNYLDSARDVAGQTKSLFTNAFSSMEDAVVTFATTGKFSFADFTKSVLADMARIAARQAASSALSGLFGLATTAVSAYFGSGSGNGMAAGSAGAVSSNLGASSAGYSAAYGFSDGGFTGDGGKYDPAGIVHGGEVVIRKEVVDQPGMKDFLVNLNARGYAEGGYVTPSVPASITRFGSSPSGSPVVIQQSFAVPEGSSSESTDTQSQAVAQAYARAAKQGATEQIAKELRPGGMIWSAMNGRQ